MHCSFFLAPWVLLTGLTFLCGFIYGWRNDIDRQGIISRLLTVNTIISLVITAIFLSTAAYFGCDTWNILNASGFGIYGKIFVLPIFFGGYIGIFLGAFVRNLLTKN